MQRERSALDSFLEPIDLNQGSLPSNTSVNHSSSWDNMLCPVDNQLPNYMLGSNDANIPCTSAANDTAQCFSGWDIGESSSSANNMQDGSINDGSKPGLGWASIFKACSGSDPRSENWAFESSDISNHGSMNTSTNHGLMNTSTNHGSMNAREQDYNRGGIGARLPHNLYKSSSHSEMEQIPNFYASSSNVGTFAGSSNSTTMMSENNDGPPFGTWGSSCKRKALEGTSGQFYPCGSSSSNPVPGCYTAPRNLTISSGPPSNPPQANHSEHLNPSTGGFYPSPNVPRVAETSSRSYGPNPVPFDTSRSITSTRNSGGYPRQLARPISNTNFSEIRSAMTPPMNPNNTLNHRRLMHVNEARGMHSSYPWSGSFGSSPGGGSSSGSFVASGERGGGARDEANVRSSRRSNREYPVAVSAPEIDWSYSPETSAASRNSSSGGRASSAAWLPHQQTSQSHQRLSEAAPWIPFQQVESESGVSRGQFGLLPSASSSLDEAVAGSSTSRAQQHQIDQRAAALLMDMPGDDMNGWRALTAVEGRHRLIRQVLTAMRRGVHLQAEDYMLVDPFINGYAELHDRHRDMRLDVDNMSYEELLALEERIGNVSTGLSEEQIRRSMKQRKHEAIRALRNLEPCCVCQENYTTGDDIGVLECGHEFHTNCIKQWLTLKNLCPICKTAALKT